MHTTLFRRASGFLFALLGLALCAAGSWRAAVAQAGDSATGRPAAGMTVYVPLTMGGSASSGGGDGSGEVPAELAYEWTWGGVTSSVGFYDPSTGQWANPDSAGGFYRLNADGSYEEGAMLQTSLYGCSTNTFFYDSGTFAVQGDTIAFQSSGQGVQHAVNTCGQSYDRPYDDSGSYTWSVFPHPDYPATTVLQLTGPDGSNYYYYR